MTDPRYDVVLTGHVQPGQDPTAVAAKLAALMKLPAEKATALLQGKASKVKADVDNTTATRYQTALANTGAEVRLDAVAAEPEPMPEPESEPAPEPAQPSLAMEPKAEPTFQAEATTPAEPSAPAATPYSSPNEAHLHTDDIRYCSHCGGETQRLARRCPHCRKPLPTLGRSREVAAVLALLFTGSLGIHRFYLGQWWGIFYLLLCWTGIPSLVSLVEFIVFLCTSRESWDEKHGHKSKVSGWVWVVPSFFIFIMIIGILAAVAIPAYHDYTQRTKVNQSLYEIKEIEAEIEAFVARTNFVPNSGLDMGLPDEGPLTAGSYRISENATITITFDDTTPSISGETIAVIPFLEQGEFVWDCTGGTLEPKYRPEDCRP